MSGWRQLLANTLVARLNTSSFWWLPGVIGLGVLVLLVGAPFVALLSHADAAILTEPLHDPYIRRVIWFSLYQAVLSTSLAILCAVPVALALSRRGKFFGRSALINIFSVSLIIPTIVAIFGIVAVFGRTGWINQLLSGIGIEWQMSIYGLNGILLAHVFFNMPLCARIFLQSLESIPDNNWRLSAQLGMRPTDVFRLLEWPAIRQQIAGIAVLVFSLCFTSFAIVMTLGGGPRATTIEVAIYQALRFDFDLELAVSLALIQFVICATIMALTLKRSSVSVMSLGKSAVIKRYSQDSGIVRTLDISVIAIACIFVTTPLMALIATAINPAITRVVFAPQTVKAVVNTLLVGLSSGLLSVLVGCLLLSTSRHLHVRLRRQTAGKLLELAGLVILVVPPVVLGTGLFLLLRPHADVFSLTLILVILVNALMGLPFVLRVLSNPVRHVAQRHDRLCSSLGIVGANRIRLIEWPVLRRPLGLALALVTTLSAGDLTVIALFGSERVVTLPLLLYQRMGSYRMYDAAVTALVLLIICFFLFWALDRCVGGSRAATR